MPVILREPPAGPDDIRRPGRQRTVTSRGTSVSGRAACRPRHGRPGPYRPGPWRRCAVPLVPGIRAVHPPNAARHTGCRGRIRFRTRAGARAASHRRASSRRRPIRRRTTLRRSPGSTCPGLPAGQRDRLHAAVLSRQGRSLDHPGQPAAQYRAVTLNPAPCSGSGPAPAPEPGFALSRRRASKDNSSDPMSPPRLSRTSRQTKL